MGGVDELVAAVEHLGRLRQESDDPEELTMMLYGSWYACALDPPEIPPSFPLDLVQALRAADATGREWSGGWRADRVAPDGRVIARRDRAVRMADRCDYIAPGAVGVLPQPGDALILADRRDRTDGDGAWWRTSGRTWRFTRAVPGLVRLYWNFSLRQLPELVCQLTEMLADDDQPWMLKCATEPQIHARPDATVLYLCRNALERLASEIDRVAYDLRADARVGRPPLTLQIQPGVAAAVDPGQGESFGLHRCRMLVEASLSAPATAEDAVLQAIEDRLAVEGIDPARPYALRTDPLLPWER